MLGARALLPNYTWRCTLFTHKYTTADVALTGKINASLSYDHEFTINLCTNTYALQDVMNRIFSCVVFAAVENNCI